MIRDYTVTVLRRNRRLFGLNTLLAGFNIAGTMYAVMEGEVFLALVLAAVAFMSSVAAYWVDRGSRRLEDVLGPRGNGHGSW